MRLRLRGHRLDDFPGCAARWADPAICRQLGRKPFTEVESWTRLLRYVGHWVLLGFGYWVVEEKESGRFVGEVGFADYKRDMESPVRRDPEIGWVFCRQGKGYATEAARAAILWGDEHFGASRTTCIISPEKLPSIRVAEKCGYRNLQLTLYKGKPIIVVCTGTGSSESWWGRLRPPGGFSPAGPQLIAAGFGLHKIAVHHSRDRRIVLRTQSQGDERKRIDLAGGIQDLLGLKLLQGIGGRCAPGAIGIFRRQVAPGHQGALDLLITIGRGGGLAIAPRGMRNGRFLGLPDDCRHGGSCRQIGRAHV